MKKEMLEEVLEKKIQPVIDDAMKKYLGVRMEEIKGDISDKLLNSPLLGLKIDFYLSFKEAKKKFKQRFLRKLLQMKHGNISEVARLTGVDRRSIHRLIDKTRVRKIRKELFKPYYLKQKEVEDIIGNVLHHYEDVLREEKIEKMYEATPRISKNIVDELPDMEMSLKEAEEEFEKEYLKVKLKENDNNISKTAKRIKLRYETLLRKLNKLSL